MCIEAVIVDVIKLDSRLFRDNFYAKCKKLGNHIIIDHSVESPFKDADTVFLIYIILYPDFTKR